MTYKAFRTRVKLDNKQATLMAKHAGYARFVFNWGLRLWNEAYKDGLKPSTKTLKKVFTNYVKPQLAWMSELSSKVYQYAFINLGDAFSRFFKKLGGYPKFKKKGRHDSFTIDNSGAPIKLGGIRHKLPFIGWVSTYEALPECVVKKVTLSRQAGCWYISFAIEVPEENTPKRREVIGVDLGINALATCSDGSVFPNSKAKKIADASFYEVRRQLEYKTQRYGSTLTFADRFYPSSQLCSDCGHRQKMPLKQRTFECGNCGALKDRDFNASLNLEQYPTSVGLTDNTCGGGAADSPRRSKK